MKWYLFLFVLGIIVLEPVSAQSRSLTITFHSSEKNGVIRIAAYSVNSTFLETEKAEIKQSVPFEVDSTVVELLIPTAIVAISAFHDVDTDNKLDKSFIGIPTEPYGFSNDARGMFGPPGFEDCVIDLAKTNQITIHLK